eukprot:gene3760-4681_t
MVKFLSFDLFDGQNLLPSEDDDTPIDIIPALNDFLMSTKGGEIIHYNIGAKDCTVLNRFSTLNSTILNLFYIPSNDSILTLEKDDEKSDINVARLYQNWRQNQLYYPSHLDGVVGGSPIDSSPVIDHFSSTSPISASGGNIRPIGAPINVYKIPFSSTISTINVCPITSRVIIGSTTRSSISVWGSSPGNTNTSFISSFEQILEISIENVTHVALYENYLAYSTPYDIKVLSLLIEHQEPTNEELTSNLLLLKSVDFNSVNNGPSEIIEDCHYFEVSFDSNGNPTGKNQLSGLETTSSSSGNEIEVLGPINDTEHSIIVNMESGYLLLASTLLLSRKIIPGDDIVHSLFFLPDFQIKSDLQSSSSSSIPNNNTTPNNSMKSNHHIFGGGNNSSTSSPNPTTNKRKNNHQLHQNNNQNNNNNTNTQNNNQNNNTPSTTSNNNSSISMLMRFFVSTQKQGYLYNISKPTLLASYTYANETILCTASPYFLYTITTENIVTWTLRPCDANDGEDLPTPCGFGLRNFLYLNRIAVVGDYLLILSKYTEQSQSKNQKIPSIMRSPSRTLSPSPKKIGNNLFEIDKGKSVWSLYILHHTPLKVLYDEIINYAISKKEIDEEVYHLLLLEGHFLLQSKIANQHRSIPNMHDIASLLNYDLERKIYQTLLKSSSSYLGDYFLTKQKDYMRSALWYSSSDSDIEHVYKLFKDIPGAHQSLIYYLEHVLYNPSSFELLVNKEELCNNILQHYHKYSPHRLPLLILESSISSYSQTLAIDLLKSIIKQKSDLELEENNMIHFALGLLYLDQSNIEETIQSFNQIPSESLISLCLKNPKLLAPPGESSPTALCKILRQSTPWGLLEITFQLVTKREISPEFGLTILINSTSTFLNGILSPISYNHQDYDLDSNNSSHSMYTSTSSIASSLSMGLIEDLVPIFTKYLIHLYVQDIHRFRGADDKLFQSLKLDIYKILNSSTLKSSQQKQQKLVNQHGDEYCNHWILFHLQVYSTIPQWLSKLPPFAMENNNPSAKDEVKSLLSPLYYKKLQSLLSNSNSKIRDFEFMDTIESIFGENSDNIMLFSLKLACLPLRDRIKEGIQLVVESNHISIILDYALHFCKQHSDWSNLLECVLRKYQQTDSSSNQLEKETIITEYEGILDHLTGYLDPESFLHLLPSNGKIDYFLPFIEKSFSSYQSKLLKSNLTDYLLDIENE